MDRSGTVLVDDALMCAPGCFVIGDAAHLARLQHPLAMASYYSIQQGRRAGSNIARLIGGRQPKRYRPMNLGFVVPLATGRGVGRLLGVPVKGRLANLFHNLITIFRMVGLRRKLSLTAEIVARVR